MRRVASCLALVFFVAAATPPLRAQATGPSACVTATGPDVTPVTPDSAATRADSARQATSATAGRGATPTSGATNPALRLLASVQAEEVRFARQPKICVQLRGDAQLDSVRVVARRNIRSPVTVGTTYRNVYVAVEILGHLNAQCISARITGQATDGACASLEMRDSAASPRAPSREGSP